MQPTSDSNIIDLTRHRNNQCLRPRDMARPNLIYMAGDHVQYKFCGAIRTGKIIKSKRAGRMTFYDIEPSNGGTRLCLHHNNITGKLP